MLKINENKQGLQISFGEIEILCHSSENPAFFIGKGCSTYEMYHGNFEFTNELESKYPLVNFQIVEKTPETAVNNAVIFSGYDSTSFFSGFNYGFPIYWF